MRWMIAQRAQQGRQTKPICGVADGACAFSSTRIYAAKSAPGSQCGGDGSRLPTANEPAGARYQGRKIAETANKLHG
jgi:hypothetical protein